MYKAILMVALSGLCFSASAEWIEVHRNESGRITGYIDKRPVKLSGRNVTFWHLVDLQFAYDIGKGKLIRSQKSLGEYDCENMRTRTLSVAQYSGPMGRGSLIQKDETPTAWERRRSGIGDDRLWEHACGTK